MIFEEYSEKNQKNIHNVHKEQVVRSEEESKQTISRVKSQDASASLSDDALDAVAGGVGDVVVTTNIDTTVNNTDITQTNTTKKNINESVHEQVIKSVDIAGGLEAESLDLS